MASSVLCTLGTVRSLQWGHLGLLPFQYGYWAGGEVWPAWVWLAWVWPTSLLALVLSFRTCSCLPRMLSLSVQQNKTKPSSGLVPPYLEPCPRLQEPCSI